MYRPIAVQKQTEITAIVTEVCNELAPDVVRIRYDIGQDWIGDWAIFFRIVLSNAATKGKRATRVTEKVRLQLRERVKPETLDVLAYFSFSVAQIKGVIQKLLADRFQLKFHREKQELSVYAITQLNTGARINKSEADPNGLPGLFFGRGTHGTSFNVRNGTMAEVASTFARQRAG
jgi:hypothetical protein